MLLPPVRERREIDRRLAGFFREHEPVHFRQALRQMARYYRLPTPKITWFEYLDWGKTGGRTYQNGKIHLVHPEHWKRGRKYNSERRWINMIYHEIGHYIFWSDAERKADVFALRMVRGLRNGASSQQRLPGILEPDRTTLDITVRARRDGKRAPARKRRARPRRS